MKTLAKTKKTGRLNKFEVWLESIEIPTWVKRRIIAPLVIIAVFFSGALFQFGLDFFKHPAPVVEYAAAKLTANELWKFDNYACTSMQKLFDIIEEGGATKEEVIALARVEEKATNILLQPWNTYPIGKKLTDDWHDNAHYIWTRVITMANNYDHRHEPWFEKKYPSVSKLDNFDDYLTAAVEAPYDNGRPVHWIVTLKRCIYEPQEPAATTIEVTHSEDDKRYCPIYARFKTLNFDDPQSIAIFAQNNSLIVNHEGLESANWSQIEITLSTLLATMTDAQLSIPNTKAYEDFIKRPPLQVLTNRLDLLCGA